MPLQLNAAHGPVGVSWTAVKEVPAFLRDIYRLCSEERDNAAVDLVIDAFDDALAVNNNDWCDNILRAANLDALSTRVMLALLMETFRARAVLEYRNAFCDSVTRKLRETLDETKVHSLIGTLK